MGRTEPNGPCGMQPDVSLPDLAHSTSPIQSYHPGWTARYYPVTSDPGFAGPFRPHDGGVYSSSMRKIENSTNTSLVTPHLDIGRALGSRRGRGGNSHPAHPTRERQILLQPSSTLSPQGHFPCDFPLTCCTWHICGYKPNPDSYISTSYPSSLDAPLTQRPF